MTDMQVKYQTLQENIRHNAEMERLGRREAAVAEAKVAKETAMMPFEIIGTLGSTIGNIGRGIGSVGKLIF